MRTPQSSIKKSAVALALAQLRRHLQESQAVFAKRMGVSPITVARWETTHRPSLEALQSILEIAKASKFREGGAFREALAGQIPSEPARDMQPYSAAGDGQPLTWIETQRLLQKALAWAVTVKEEGPRKGEALEALFKVSDRIMLRMMEDLTEAVSRGATRDPKGGKA